VSPGTRQFYAVVHAYTGFGKGTVSVYASLVAMYFPVRY